jgi:hypothetical protein
MINPLFDPLNYLYRCGENIYKKDYQLIDKEFESNRLLIRWKVVGNFKGTPQGNLKGVLRVHRKTPLGEIEPQDFTFNLSRVSPAKTYVQFLELSPVPGFTYKIEALNPVGVEKSSLEISEYIAPITFFTNNSMSNTYGNDQIIIDNSALAAAIVAGDVATITAINALPNSVADAIANNAMNTNVSNPLTINTSPTLILAADPNRQVVEIANRGNTKMRIRVSNVAPAASTTYQNIDFTTELIAATGAVGSPGYKAGGTWVASPEQAKSPIYIISDAAGGTVVTTTTVTAP